MSRTSSWCSLRALGPVRRCALLCRYGLRCVWCGVELTQATAQVDHLVPRREGGTHALHNLVAACDRCNGDEDMREGIALDRGLLHAPLDYDAGRRLALRWYPALMAHRDADKVRRKRERRRHLAAANREAREAGLGGAAFPFGASP